MSAPLAEKDVNVVMADAQIVHDGDDQAQPPAKDVKSMEYHRQILADKLAKANDDDGSQYVSPSDGIMSPCTAKLSALRTKKMDKSVKPKSLFQKASARNLGSGGSLFGSKSILSKTQKQPLRPVAVSINNDNNDDNDNNNNSSSSSSSGGGSSNINDNDNKVPAAPAPESSQDEEMVI